ncbi:phage tail tape measure protein, TP901 family, core region [Xylanibacter ruminicola]|uniref:Phage tail tape measure protein, TP901 family, core region n=1 Tax=Xylanibacter ruminicola TaxID=839 RepID=A0A1M7CPR2_XYLRU|nr:phage tail tape measure protein [Xylanibacter ruminicola]SHL69286.1 phage tail tape measure protein, TP901 family, core region [Xylanibacter ruminicola]
MSSINTNATVTLTVNGKQAQDMLDNLTKKSQDLEHAIENAAKAGNKVELKRLQKELKQTNRQIAQIESASVGVEKVLKNLDKATPKELNKTLATLKKQLNGIERGTEQWHRQAEAIKRVKAELAKVNTELTVGEGFWDRFNRKMNDWQTTLMGMIAAATGIIMAGRSAVKAYADIDAEMANVRKFTGMAKEQVEDLNEEFKKMDTRSSREQLNILAEEAGKLGKQSKEDIMGFVKAADQINVALDELGDGATLTLSKLTNIFGDEERLGTEKALLSVGSVINELSQNCTASAPYLANFAKRMAGVGAQAEMTIPQIMGLAAVLDSQGQAVEMSATAVSKLIMDMFKQQDKIIKATGMNAEKFKQTLAKGTNEGLLMLLDTLDKLGNIDVLAPIFKDMGENGARVAQVISALAGNLDMIRWEQSEAAKAFKEATSVTKEYNVQNTTVQAGLDKARKRVKEMAIELGEKLQPVMRHVLSSTTLILKVLSTLVDFILKYKGTLITLTAAVVGYYTAVKLQHLWSLRYIAVAKLKAAAIAIENTALAASILKHKVLRGEITAAAAAQTFFNKVLKMNPMGVAITAMTFLIGLYVKFAKSSSTAAAAQKRLKDINEEADRNTREEINRIEQLKRTIENESLSVNKRRKAIEELQQIIPDYHASISEEGQLYGHNIKILKNYTEQLKNSAKIKAALDKLPDAEHQRDVHFNDAPHNIQDAYFNENQGQSESEAIRSANVSPTAYRAWKLQQSRLDKTVTQYNKIIESLTADNQRLADEAEKLAKAKDPKKTPTPPPTDDSKKQERFKEEKDWKAKEEALNRISYATGQQNYEQYQKRILEIEIEYQTKILQHSDLTEIEKLEAQAAYAEAEKKQSEQHTKITVEQETQLYNEAMSIQKQRYIDGQIDQEIYQQSTELLELNHLKRMTSIYEEGTTEYTQAQPRYQDKLIADQKRRQQETEAAEKKHLDQLKKIKEEYFGDNRSERTSKYMTDLEALKVVYDLEIQAADNNAQEKLRIEEDYQKAKKALRKKYGIDELDDNKSFLEEWTSATQEWLQSDMGKAVTGSLDVISSGMSSIFQQMSSLIQAEADIQIAAIEKRYQTEISNAEGNNYIVKKLEKQKEQEVAKVKSEANKKMFKMQVMQAIAQTATSAINAYSSAAAVPLIGYILAPIAAASAVAAGMLQVAAIKKQQEASAAQGYAKGGFTGEGGKYEVAGIVHKGEWVASQELLQSPVARPMIEALDYAQRTNTIGSLRSDDVSRSIVAPSVYAQSAPSSPTVILQPAQQQSEQSDKLMKEYADIMRQLKDRLSEPFVTVNTVTGDTGIKQAQDEYAQLIRNKSPKSRRK